MGGRIKRRKGFSWKKSLYFLGDSLAKEIIWLINRKGLIVILFFLLASCLGDPGQKGIEKVGEEITCPEGFKVVKVEKVIDGDTVVLRGGEKLRYAGINTTELHTDEGPPQPYAKEAFLKNKELTEGKTLCFEKAVKERDRFGRLLGELYFPNGTSVSELLLKEGLAFVCYYEGGSKYFERLLPIQREALSEGKNLFSYVNKPQGQSKFIGNKKTRRFHHPQCLEGIKIKKKIIFNNLREALWEGYCPSRECINLIFAP
ncbi:MAG: thermonuclease family protein [Caldimicrobium sp.]